MHIIVDLFLFHAYLCCQRLDILTSFYWCCLLNICSQLHVTSLHYNWSPAVTQRLEMMARMWSSGNFATNNILENITWHFGWHGRTHWWPRAEIVRNHINGYRGGAGLFTQIDDGASFCCKYSTNVNTHSQTEGGWWEWWLDSDRARLQSWLSLCLSVCPLVSTSWAPVIRNLTRLWTSLILSHSHHIFHQDDNKTRYMRLCLSLILMTWERPERER